MASESLISILISAKDEASKVIAGVAEQSAVSAKALNDSQASSAQSTSNLSSTMSGLAVVAAGAAVAVGVVSVKAAADYQSALTRLVTSAGESQANLALVSSGIQKVAIDTGTSTTQLTAAMYTIESAGQHGADGLLVLKAAAQGAKEENASVATVADAVSSALQDYHLKASSAAQVTSSFIAAIGQGKTNFQDFAGSLSSVLPIASAAHVSLDDVSASIASMTLHGMSADQATQDLAHSIEKMQSPTQSMTSYLAQLGINSQDLAADLGSEGISGTLQTISNAILQNMGPAGTVLINSLNQSKVAAQDANTMIASMPASLQAMAKSYADGDIDIQQYRNDIKAMPADQAAMMEQFANLQNNVDGFNTLLKSGSPAAKTYAAALQQATGDSTTLNTALMLTGENAGTVNTALGVVSKATTDASGNVQGWSDIQGNFNQKMSQLAEIAQVATIRLGTDLLPVLTDTAGGFVDLFDAIGQHSGQMDSLIDKVHNYLDPDFLKLKDTVKNELEPSLKELWKDVIEPMIPVLGVAFVLAIQGAINALVVTTKAVSDLAKFVAQNKDILEPLILAFLAFKTAMFIGTTVAAFQEGMAASTVAIEGTESVYKGFAALLNTPIVLPSLAVGAVVLALTAIYTAATNAANAIKSVTQLQNASASVTNQILAKNEQVQASGVASAATKAKYQALANEAVAQDKSLGFALGTNYAPGGVALVGENGPELVNLPQGSKVNTATQTQQLLGNKGTQVTIGVWNNNSNMDERRFLAMLGRKLAVA